MELELEVFVTNLALISEITCFRAIWESQTELDSSQTTPVVGCQIVLYTVEFHHPKLINIKLLENCLCNRTLTPFVLRVAEL